MLVFGPFGMFYWGFLAGVASFLGMALFILLTTFFGLGVGFWYHILIRVVFLTINHKILSMPAEEQRTFATLDLRSFLLLVWMVAWNFIIFGGIGFVIWSIVT